MKRIACIFALVALAASPVLAVTRENSCHTMAAGTFGIAMIGPDATILVSDGRAVPEVLLSGTKAARLLAADLTGDGRDELAFLDVERRSLHYYDFTTKQTSGPYGTNVNGFTSGRFATGEKFDSIVAGTVTSVPYRWTTEVGPNHWHELPGDFNEVVRAETDARNQVDEVAVISRGDIYLYNPIWQAFIVTAEGAIERYDRAKNTWDAAFAPGNSGWCCLILADTDSKTKGRP